MFLPPDESHFENLSGDSRKRNIRRTLAKVLSIESDTRAAVLESLNFFNNRLMTGWRLETETAKDRINLYFGEKLVGIYDGENHLMRDFESDVHTWIAQTDTESYEIKER